MKSVRDSQTKNATINVDRVLLKCCYGNALIKTRSNDDPESTAATYNDNQRSR